MTGPVRSRPAAVREVRGGLRPIPNEDVYLFAKAIDNSRVQRAVDPSESDKRWKAIGLCVVIALVAMAAVTPHLLALQDGYRIEALKQEGQRLADERTILDAQVSALLSAERLEQQARDMQFIDPAPGQVVYLNPRADGSLAYAPNSRRRSE